MIYEIITEWLKTYTPLNKWIYFNYTPYKIGAMSINSVPTQRIVKTYINGDTLREILFALQMVGEYDDSTTDINIKSMQEVENFAEWIEKNENYPDFGEGKTVTKIEVIDNVPDVMINTDNSQALYRVQCRISYREEKKNA